MKSLWDWFQVRRGVRILAAEEMEIQRGNAEREARRIASIHIRETLVISELTRLIDGLQKARAQRVSSLRWFKERQSI